MSAPLKLRLGVAAAGLSCLIVGYALAQQATERRTYEREGATQARDAAPGGQTGSSAAQQQGQRYTAQFRGTRATGGQDQGKCSGT
jgi:hypothetical protein